MTYRWLTGHHSPVDSPSLSENPRDPRSRPRTAAGVNATAPRVRLSGLYEPNARQKPLGVAVLKPLRRLRGAVVTAGIVAPHTIRERSASSRRPTRGPPLYQPPESYRTPQRRARSEQPSRVVIPIESVSLSQWCTSIWPWYSPRMTAIRHGSSAPSCRPSLW